VRCLILSVGHSHPCQEEEGGIEQRYPSATHAQEVNIVVVSCQINTVFLILFV